VLAAERGGARPGPVLRKASKVRIALYVYGDSGCRTLRRAVLASGGTMALTVEVLDGAGRCTSPYALVGRNGPRLSVQKRMWWRSWNCLRMIVGGYGMVYCDALGEEEIVPGWFRGVGDDGNGARGDLGGFQPEAIGTGLLTQQMLRSSSWSRERVKVRCLCIIPLVWCIVGQRLPYSKYTKDRHAEFARSFLRGRRIQHAAPSCSYGSSHSECFRARQST